VGAKRTKVESGRPLVYLADRGAVYDAPIDVVWDFSRKDQTYHPKAHRSSVRNFRAKQLSPMSVHLTWETREGRRLVKRACRTTTIPPAVRVQEDLDGPGAGSIKVFLYSPRGRRIIVDVFAYPRNRELSPTQLKTRTRRMFASAYREDLPWFRKYVLSRQRE
jgi:hypothetical protein